MALIELKNISKIYQMASKPETVEMERGKPRERETQIW